MGDKNNTFSEERKEIKEVKENSFTQKIGGVNFIVNIKATEDAKQEAEEFIKVVVE